MGWNGIKPHIFEKSESTWPLICISVQHYLYQAFYFRTIFFKMLWKGEISLNYIFDSLVMILRLKRSLPWNQFIEKNSCSPNINSFLVSSWKHLRSSVKECSCDSPHLKINSPSFIFPFEIPKSIILIVCDKGSYMIFSDFISLWTIFSLCK